MPTFILMPISHHKRMKRSELNIIESLELKGVTSRAINIALIDCVRGTPDQLIAAVASLALHEA